MFKFAYRVSVRVGFDEFHKEFENESAALECFNRISRDVDNTPIEDDRLTLESDATVDSVSIQRFAVALDIGNPNRR